MKRVTLWCPSCGTKLEADAGEARVTCARCGITFPVGEDVQQRAAGESAATRTDAADSASRRQNEEATEGPRTSEEEERRARESRERRDEALRAWEQKQRDAEQRRLETDARRRVEEEKKNKKTANLYGYILVFGVFGLMLLFILFYRPASAPSAGTGESSERPAAEQTDGGKGDELAGQEKASGEKGAVATVKEETEPAMVASTSDYDLIRQSVTYVPDYWIAKAVSGQPDSEDVYYPDWILSMELHNKVGKTTMYIFEYNVTYLAIDANGSEKKRTEPMRVTYYVAPNETVHIEDPLMLHPNGIGPGLVNGMPFEKAVIAGARNEPGGIRVTDISYDHIEFRPTSEEAATIAPEGSVVLADITYDPDPDDEQGFSPRGSITNNSQHHLKDVTFTVLVCTPEGHHAGYLEISAADVSLGATVEGKRKRWTKFDYTPPDTSANSYYRRDDFVFKPVTCEYLIDFEQESQ